MASEKISQLPTVASALAADLIYAVQGGVSVQETLQQVLNLGLSNTILNFNANPNGSVAGKTFQLLWDTVNHALYVCTTTGSSSTAVWTEVTTGVNLTGQTGTGAFVGSVTPTITTPVLNGPTLTNASSTTEFKFTNTTLGITGTATNNNAAVGVVGQLISSIVLASSPVALTDNIAANITSIALTAGDWNVWGNVRLNGSTFNMDGAGVWASTVSAVQPTTEKVNAFEVDVGNELSVWGSSIPYQRVSLASPATLYLSTQCGFSTGTVAASGQIFARRAR